MREVDHNDACFDILRASLRTFSEPPQKIKADNYWYIYKNSSAKKKWTKDGHQWSKGGFHWRLIHNKKLWRTSNWLMLDEDKQLIRWATQLNPANNTSSKKRDQGQTLVEYFIRHKTKQETNRQNLPELFPTEMDLAVPVLSSPVLSNPATPLPAVKSEDTTPSPLINMTFPSYAEEEMATCDLTVTPPIPQLNDDPFGSPLTISPLEPSPAADLSPPESPPSRPLSPLSSSSDLCSSDIGSSSGGQPSLSFNSCCEYGLSVEASSTDRLGAVSADIVPLYYAFRTRDIGMVLRLSFPVCRKNSNNDTLLHVACRHGFAEGARLLLDLGADINAQNTRGNTPLHFAYGRGDMSLVQMLLAEGADPGLRNCFGELPLDLLNSAVAIKPESSKPDKKAYAISVHIKEWDLTFSLSVWQAARVGFLDAVMVYVNELHCDVNTRKSNGLTTLHCSCQHGRIRVSDFLLRNGADVNAVDYEMNTPLHCACERGDNRLVKLLLSYGADPTIRNARGKLPADLWVGPGLPKMEKRVVDPLSPSRVSAEDIKELENEQPAVEGETPETSSTLEFIDGMHAAVKTDLPYMPTAVGTCG